MPISVPNSDPVARAQQSAQLKYGGQEDAVKRAISSLAVTRAADQAAINQYGDSGRGAINTTFDELLGNLGVNRERAAADLNTQANLVGQGYRDANQIAEAARQQGASNLAGLVGNSNTFSAEQLAAAQSPLETLAARIIGDNAQNDATTTGNLRTWAAQHDALRGAGMDDARRDKSNRLSGFESELLGSLAKSKNDATNQEFDFESALLDLLNERGAYTADQANSISDMLFNQQLQAAQYNLSEQEAMSQAAARNSASSMASDELAWRKQQAAEAGMDMENYWKQMAFDQNDSQFAAEMQAKQVAEAYARAAEMYPGNPFGQEVYLAKSGIKGPDGGVANIGKGLGQAAARALLGIKSKAAPAPKTGIKIPTAPKGSSFQEQLKAQKPLISRI